MSSRQKKKKLSDEIVINLWNKKKRIVSNDNKVEEFVFEPTPEELMEEFELETNKHAIWNGKVTKQYIRWLGERYG